MVTIRRMGNRETLTGLSHKSDRGARSFQYLRVMEWKSRPMEKVVPFFQKLHVLFVENDWVIRQILMEHFAVIDSCHVVSFGDADKALSYLHAECGADRIFSNVQLGGMGGIDLSSGLSWQCRIELAIAPGYDTEDDRFRAIEAGLGFFRVKPYSYLDLLQLVRHSIFQSSYK